MKPTRLNVPWNALSQQVNNIIVCCCNTVVTFSYFFYTLSGYNLLLQPQKNLKMKSPKLNVAWNALGLQVNNRNVIQVDE